MGGGFPFFTDSSPVQTYGSSKAIAGIGGNGGNVTFGQGGLGGYGGWAVTNTGEAIAGDGAKGGNAALLGAPGNGGDGGYAEVLNSDAGTDPTQGTGKALPVPAAQVAAAMWCSWPVVSVASVVRRSPARTLSA